MDTKFTDSIDAIAKARATLHLSIEQLAELAQVDPRFIKRIEAGETVPAGPALRNIYRAMVGHATETARDLGAITTDFRQRAAALEEPPPGDGLAPVSA